MASKTEPSPAPTPSFAISYGEPETTRRLRALRMGEAKGWWTILPPKNPADPPNKIVFRVRLPHPSDPTKLGPIRELLGAEIMTYVLGIADAHGAGNEFTYREGQ